MSIVIFNYLPEDIIKREYLGFTAEQVQIGLIKVTRIYAFIKLRVKHPQMPELAFVETIIKELYSESKEDPASLLFYLAEANLREIKCLK